METNTRKATLSQINLILRRASVHWLTSEDLSDEDRTFLIDNAHNLSCEHASKVIYNLILIPAPIRSDEDREERERMRQEVKALLNHYR